MINIGTLQCCVVDRIQWWVLVNVQLADLEAL
jgi:hypothetical protein